MTLNMADNPEDKSITITAKLWWDEDQRYIKLANSGDFITAFSNDPNSDRYHPNSFKKFAKLLKRHGKPAPNLADN